MKKGLTIALFLIVAVIQIAAPLSMILKREYVLKNGERYKFMVEPVDPFDAFRGRYIAIKIKSDEVPLGEHKDLKPGQKVYALIIANQDLFSNFFDVTTVRPKNSAYIEAKIDYISRDRIKLGLPINRYYMNETAAPKAERLFRQANTKGDSKQDACVYVRVKDGFPVIEQLYIGNLRIEDAAKIMNPQIPQKTQ